MMSEKQVRSYRDDIKKVLEMKPPCSCFRCAIADAATNAKIIVQLELLAIILEETDASRMIENVASLVRAKPHRESK